MAKNLVIVESPAKSKTLARFLGKDFDIMATVGHIIDLPKSKLGVDVKNNFEPDYTVIDGKQKIITELRKSRQEGRDRLSRPRPGSRRRSHRLACRQQHPQRLQSHVPPGRLQRNHQARRRRRHQPPARNRYEPRQRPAGPPGARPHRGLHRFTLPVENGRPQPLRRTGPVGRASIGLRARGRDSRRLSLRGILDDQGRPPGEETKSSSPPACTRSTKRRSSSRPTPPTARCASAPKAKSTDTSTELKKSRLESRDDQADREDPPSRRTVHYLDPAAGSGQSVRLFSPKQTMAIAQKLYEGVDIGQDERQPV